MGKRKLPPAQTESGYPHFKLTRAEMFPRLLVTRRVRGDGAQYFGPFLPDTGVRRMLDLAQRLFKLRSCVQDTFHLAIQTVSNRMPCLRK